MNVRHSKWMGEGGYVNMGHRRWMGEGARRKGDIACTQVDVDGWGKGRYV